MQCLFLIICYLVDLLLYYRHQCMGAFWAGKCSLRFFSGFLPVFQGLDLQEWESEEKEAELRVLLQQKEEKLKQLRNGERVSVEEIEFPEDGEPNRDVRLPPRTGQRTWAGFLVLTVCLFFAETFPITKFSSEGHQGADFGEFDSGSQSAH